MSSYRTSVILFNFFSRLNIEGKIKLIIELLKRLFTKSNSSFYKILDLESDNILCVSDNNLIHEINHFEYIIIKGDSTSENTVVKLRPNSSDANVFVQIFGKNREYKAIVELIDKLNQSSRIKHIIDAGANVGFASLFFLKIYPEANIIAIEPDLNNYTLAKKNFKLNNLSVALLQCGLWYRKAKLKISNTFRDGQFWALTVLEDNEGTINAINLEEILNQFEIDFIDILKMDIEGTEKYIFENLEETNFLAKTKFISLEIHDELHCRELIYKILEKNSFSYIAAGEGIIGYNKLLHSNT